MTSGPNWERRRIGAYFLSLALIIVTLVIGYLICGLVLCGKGRSPALRGPRHALPHLIGATIVVYDPARRTD